MEDAMKARISKPALVFAGALAACSGATAQAEYRLDRASPEMALAHDTCVNVLRVRPGFVPFDACVESLTRTLSNPSITRKTPASYAINQPAQTSYSQSNAEERRRKEEYACARLGISPGTGGFGQCVAELDSALRSTEHSD
jgi:hypothetical protein